MTDKQESMRASLLMYDIPSRSGLGNPSAMLWRFGARVNLSCWVVPERNVPLIPVKMWREKGARVEFVRFDERDWPTILRLAQEALVREITDMREGLEQGEADVRRRIEAVESGNAEQLKKASSYAYNQVRRAKTLAVSARECALAFYLMGEVEHLIDGLRKTIKAKDALYYGWQQRKQRNEPLDEAIEQVGTKPGPAGRVPPTVELLLQASEVGGGPEPLAPADGQEQLNATESVFGCVRRQS